jgi:hypothetical protein
MRGDLKMIGELTMRTKVEWNSVAGISTVRGGFWLSAAAVAGFVACVVVLTPNTTQAQAPSSFYESFTSPGLPGELEESPNCQLGSEVFNGNVTFASGVTGGSSREYLRTKLANYNNTNFVAEVTVTIRDGDGGDGIAFFGLGEGDGNPGFFCEPDVAPAAYVRIFPGDFFDAAVGFTTNFDGPADPSENQKTTNYAAGAGTHRARLIWNHVLKTLTFAIDQNYTGGIFAADTMIGINLNDSPTPFGDPNTRIYIGGENITFDDLRVIALAGMAGDRNCHGQSVKSLTNQFGDMTTAASALQFASVKELHNLITGFCSN